MLYLNCMNGASKDSIASALIGLLDNPESYNEILNSLNIPNTKIKLEQTTDRDVKGWRISVETSEIRHHTSLNQIHNILNGLRISNNARALAFDIYDVLGSAEARAHDTDVANVHFHEVGNNEAIACITCVCVAIDILKQDEIVASPIKTGIGKVVCAHGEMNIPTPATKNILESIPNIPGDECGEYCTPTGAAIVKALAHRYGGCQRSVPKKQSIGLGKGKCETPDFVNAMCF